MRTTLALIGSIVLAGAGLALADGICPATAGDSPAVHSRAGQAAPAHRAARADDSGARALDSPRPRTKKRPSRGSRRLPRRTPRPTSRPGRVFRGRLLDRRPGGSRNSGQGAIVEMYTAAFQDLPASSSSRPSRKSSSSLPTSPRSPDSHGCRPPTAMPPNSPGSARSWSAATASGGSPRSVNTQPPQRTSAPTTGSKNSSGWSANGSTKARTTRSRPTFAGPTTRAT